MSQDLPVGQAPTREQLIVHLGHPFLAWISASAASDVQEHVAGRKTLLPMQASVLEQALALAGEIVVMWRRPSASNDPGPQTGEPAEPVSSVLSRFCTAPQGRTETLATLLRRQAGGLLPSLPGDHNDQLLQAILRMARDVYPALLLPPSDLERRFGPSGFYVGLYFHSSKELLIEALGQQREPLRHLFPDSSSEMASSKPFLASSGHGGSLQITLLTESLIASAAERLGWPEPIPAERFLEEVATTVAELRLLARGRTVEVPAKVGLGPARVDRDFRAETPLGTLAPELQQGAELPGAAAPDLVLQTSFPLRLWLDYELGSADLPKGFFDCQRRFDHRVDAVRLAVLLASDPEDPIPLYAVNRRILDPIQRGGWSWAVLATAPGSKLEITRATAITEWTQRLEPHYEKRLGLAMRRAVSAADPVRDVADRLIDAVIVLEGLFGTGDWQQEVGFRIATALACLLEADLTARRKLHRKFLHDVYPARSRLLHSGQIPDPVELGHRQREALDLVLESLRRLLRDHPELIDDDDRGKTLILAGGPPGPGVT